MPTMTIPEILRVIFPNPLRVVLYLYGLTFAGAMAYIIFR